MAPGVRRERAARLPAAARVGRVHGRRPDGAPEPQRGHRQEARAVRPRPLEDLFFLATFWEHADRANAEDPRRCEGT